MTAGHETTAVESMTKRMTAGHETTAVESDTLLETKSADQYGNVTTFSTSQQSPFLLLSGYSIKEYKM